MSAAKVIFVLGSAAALAGATVAVAVAAATADGHGSAVTHPAGLLASQPKPAGPAAADRTAVSYADVHYRGPGAARVLATEPDTDRGQAVYDVRVLAPDGAMYVVHVSRASGAVLWASKAEGLAGTRQAGASEEPHQGEAERGVFHTEGDSTHGGLAQDD